MISDLNTIVAEYAIDKLPIKLLDWIPINKLNMSLLSTNITAIPFLEDNPNLIDWKQLSSNPAAIDLLNGVVFH